MKLTVQIFSWIFIVCGAAAILASLDQYTVSDAMISLLSGGLCLAYGILTLVYIKNNKK
jgi:hypothetical protein